MLLYIKNKKIWLPVFGHYSLTAVLAVFIVVVVVVVAAAKATALAVLLVVLVIIIEPLLVVVAGLPIPGEESSFCRLY